MHKLNDRTVGIEWLVGAALFLGFLFAASVAAVAQPAPPVPPAAPGNAPQPNDRKSLIQCLDNDFNDLLKAEANPQPLRDVQRLMAQTDQKSHWNYIEAAALIRRQRSKAAIPLLLKYMVERAGDGDGGRIIAAYSGALNLLVGQRIEIPECQGPDRQATMEKAVIKLYVDWWQPNKQTLTTDPAKMNDDRIKFVVSELLRHSAREIQGPGARSQTDERLVSGEGLFRTLEQMNNEHSRHGPREWWKEELDGSMTAVLLEQAGYRQKPPDNPHGGLAPVALPAVPLLAALRQMRKAPTLDKIAADPKQDGAARIICILAMHLAGDDISYKVPLELLDADERLDVRLLSLLAIGLYQRDQTPVPRLLKALDDNNAEVRIAALWAMRTLAPKAALPKLIKIVNDQEPPEMVWLATMTLGEIGGNDAGAALVGALEKYVKDGGDTSNLARTLGAFATLTGQRDMMVKIAGAHDPAFFMEQARQAIAWWRAHHR